MVQGNAAAPPGYPPPVAGNVARQQVPGDPGLAQAITDALARIERGVQTSLPVAGLELQQRILVTQTAILLALIDGLTLPNDADTYLANALEIIGSDFRTS